MDADGGHRRRPRRGPRVDGRQRGGRARYLRWRRTRRERRWRPTPRCSCCSMAGQRRGALDSDRPRVGIRHRREGTRSPRTSGSSAPRRRSRCSSRRTVKVAARVLAADPVRDVAILWIDPKVIASVRPVPLGCAQAAKTPGRGRAGDLHNRRSTPSAEGHDVRNREPRGAACHRRPTSILAPGSAGGPVFTADGGVVGITSVVSEKDESSERDSRVVPIDDVCDVVASAEKKMKDAAPPGGTPLPVEPVRPFPADALKDAARTPRGQPEPIPDVLVDLRRRLHHARDDLCARSIRTEQARNATIAAARARRHSEPHARAPADGLRQLVRVRRRTFRRCCWSE